jgi:hypothetical protein
MPKITPDPADLTELSIKRFYLPFVVSDACAKCGKQAEADLDRDGSYLSYPSLVKPERVYLYCEACEREWCVCIRVTFSLALVPDDADPDADEEGGEE